MAITFQKHIEEVNAECMSAVRDIKGKVDGYYKEIDGAVDKLNANLPSKALEELAEAIRNEIRKASEFLDKFDELTLEEKIEKLSAGPLKHINVSTPDLTPFYVAKNALENIDYKRFVQALLS